MRRAVLLLRRSAGSAPGGDAMQLRESAAVLGAAGWDARATATTAEAQRLLRGGDVLHLWNAQRAWDWEDLPEQARARGAAVVVTPLLHPLGLYHREGRRGLDALAARWVRDPDRFAALRWGRGDLTGRAREVLEGADAVLLAHEDERDALRRWCEAEVRGAVVPPGVPTVAARAVQAPFDRDFVLCVGRIEPLKNPLAVVRAAARLHLPVAFVGGMPRRHLLHGRAFARAARGPGVRWLGERSAGEVRGLMRAARVHVLASWTEVLGRVSVEAALEGCAVVATDVGHLAAHLGRETGGLFLAAPGDEAALGTALGQAWARGRGDGGELAKRAEALTWDRVGPALIAAYEAL